MGMQICWRKLRSGGLKLVLASTVMAAGVGLMAMRSWAGDATPPINSQASSPAAGVLAQTNTLGQSHESSLLDNLHVSGYLSETGGMWINPSNLKQFTPSRNNLATARTLLQTDENFRLNSNNEFFMREWFVYEPPYSFDSANNGIYPCSNDPGMACGNTGHTAMYRMNDFYNQYNVRDAWWKLDMGPLTLYTGNQIVVWGQSLAFRVGDVINPTDTTWDFGFSNLEQSRVPQWMLHPILNLPDLGPLSSNFIEGVLIPGAQPTWNSNNFPDNRAMGESGVWGRVNNGFPAASHGPSARFDAHYAYYSSGQTVTLTPGPGATNGFVVNPGAPNLVAAPFSRAFYFCTNGPAAAGPLASLTGFLKATGQKNPVPARLQHPCNFTSQNPGSIANVNMWHVPAVQAGNMEEGARLHTLIGQSEFTALFFNTYQYYPVISWQSYTNQFPAIFEPTQYAGATWDRPLPMPASLAEYLPFVMRAESVYQNHAPFVNLNMTESSTVAYSDIMTSMVALDLDQAYAPWLTTTGNLSANLELLDINTLNNNDNLLYGPNGGDISGNMPKNDVQMLFNIGTSYWWNAVAPNWTMIYQVYGNTFALFPGIQFNPPWSNKYFAKIGIVYVLGSAMNAVGPGLFKGENILTGTLQYNFSLL